MHSCILLVAMLSGARTQRQSILSQQLYDRMKSLFPESETRSHRCFGSPLKHVFVGGRRTKGAGSAHRSTETVWQRDEIGFVMDRSEWWTCGKHHSFSEFVRWKDSYLFAFERFKAHDPFHLRSPKMIAGIDRLSRDLKEHGHEFDGTWVTRPLREGESIESVLCGHSEKLAIVFNLIQDPRPQTIQITKNLRVCGDCRTYHEI